MSDKVRVRVVGTQFRYDREQYEKGDELEVHEGALEKHPRTLERVEEAEQATLDEADDDHEPDDETIDLDEIDPDPADLTVDELRDRVTDVDDVAILKGIRDLEEEGEDRDTALEAIDARLNELEG